MRMCGCIKCDFIKIKIIPLMKDFLIHHQEYLHHLHHLHLHLMSKEKEEDLVRSTFWINLLHVTNLLDIILLILLRPLIIISPARTAR